MKFKDIPQIPFSSYCINVPWNFLKSQLEHWHRQDMGSPLILQPDFQRGYVWNEFQQISYVEYVLKGGKAARNILFNCPSWQRKMNDPVECFDGQQRLGAALAFLDNKIQAFGTFYKDFEGNLPLDVDFIFEVFCIKDRKELIQTYLDFSKGGSVHTEKDLSSAYEALGKYKSKI